MEQSYKKLCLQHLLALKKEMMSASYQDTSYFRAMGFIDNFLKEVSNSKINGVALAEKLSVFVQEFSRELIPNGLQLTKDSIKEWNALLELFYSMETRKRIQPFVFPF